MSLTKRSLAKAGIASLVFASASLLAHCDVEGVTPQCTTNGGDCLTPPGVSDPGTGGSGGAAGAGSAGEAGAAGSGGTSGGGGTSSAGGAAGSAGRSGSSGSAGAAGTGDSGTPDSATPDTATRDTTGTSDTTASDVTADRREGGDVGPTPDTGLPLDVQLDAIDVGLR